ncbi:MAG: hypothetical protein CR987_00515 [Draconibacterium sp.]|nr:MAG: hypothetical protein CR987_00515 [Draconibacterium sp.]
MKITKKIILICFFSFFLACCDKETASVIPDYPVHFFIDLNIVNDLQIPGNSVYFPNQGYQGAGVIVYCESQGSYFAYDATCTNEVNSSCRLKNEGLTAQCSCCDSKFILVGGNVLSGVAVAPLKQYRTSLQQNRIWVYN